MRLDRLLGTRTPSRCVVVLVIHHRFVDGLRACLKFRLCRCIAPSWIQLRQHSHSLYFFPPSSGVEPMSPYRVPDQHFPCLHFFVESAAENYSLLFCIKIFSGSKYSKYVFCFENRSTGPDMCCFSCPSVSGGNFASTRAPVRWRSGLQTKSW